MTRTIRVGTIVLGALALLLTVGVLSAAAAGGANTSPATAAVIDNQTHTIPANSSLWYRFDYAGDKSLIIATLVNGNNTGLAFDVFTPGQIGDWFNETPIGRGTSQTVNCDTGAPGLAGGCQSNDLIWTGKFNANGTYYIQVMNNTGSALSFRLTVQGDGVSLAPAAGTPPTSSTAQPTTVAQTTAVAPTPAPATPAPKTPAAAGTTSNTDPGHAVFIDNAPHTIPANGSLWYSFNYAGDRSQINVTLVNGANSGVGFKVFTPAQIGDWWETAPIGQGTAQVLNCNTGMPSESGGCQSNDLIWIGQFNANGTYYVEVVNNNSTPVTAQIKIQGDSVSLGK